MGATKSRHDLGECRCDGPCKSQPTRDSAGLLGYKLLVKSHFAELCRQKKRRKYKGNLIGIDPNSGELFVRSSG